MLLKERHIAHRKHQEMGPFVSFSVRWQIRHCLARGARNVTEQLDAGGSRDPQWLSKGGLRPAASCIGLLMPSTSPVPESQGLQEPLPPIHNLAQLFNTPISPAAKPPAPQTPRDVRKNLLSSLTVLLRMKILRY